MPVASQATVGTDSILQVETCRIRASCSSFQVIWKRPTGRALGEWLVLVGAESGQGWGGGCELGVSTPNMQLSCETISVLSSAVCVHLGDRSLSHGCAGGRAGLSLSGDRRPV